MCLHVCVCVCVHVCVCMCACGMCVCVCVGVCACGVCACGVCVCVCVSLPVSLCCTYRPQPHLQHLLRKFGMDTFNPVKAHGGQPVNPAPKLSIQARLDIAQFTWKVMCSMDVYMIGFVCFAERRGFFFLLMKLNGSDCWSGQGLSLYQRMPASVVWCGVMLCPLRWTVTCYDGDGKSGHECQRTFLTQWRTPATLISECVLGTHAY